MKKVWTILSLAGLVFAALVALVFVVGREVWPIFQESRDTGAELEADFGVKPMVYWSWNSGSLTTVNVEFESIITNRPLAEIAAQTRGAVVKHFGRMPNQLIVSFEIAGEK